MFAMKIIRLSLLALLLITVQSFAASFIDDLMEAGNKAYQDGNYEEALNNYEKILHEGYVSPALFYNIGNSHFRQNQIGLAILNYERSLKMKPNDENVIYNLNIAKARIVDRIQTVPELFIFSWWKSIITTFNASGWSLIVLILYLALIVIAIVWFITKSSNLKSVLFISGMANAVVLLIAVILLISSIRFETENDFGILLQTTVTAKASPTDKSGDAFVIHEGVKFQITDKLDQWSEIKLEDGKIGWILQNTFEKI